MDTDPAVAVFVEFVEEIVGAFGQFANPGFQVAGHEKVHLEIVVQAAQHLLCRCAQGIAMFLGEIEAKVEMGGQPVDERQYDNQAHRPQPGSPALSGQLLCRQVSPGKVKEEEDDAEDIEQIAAVYHPAADAAIVEIDAEHADIIVRAGAEDGQGADVSKTAIENKTGKGCDDKGNDGIGGEAAAPNADGGEHPGQENQPQVTADRCSRIDAALAGKPLNTKEVDQGREQGYQYDDQAGEVFPEDQPAPGEGDGLQGLVCSHAELIREAAHRDRGGQQEQDPGGQLEEFVQGGIAKGQDVGIGKNEEQQPVQEQEDDDGDITEKTAKELAKLFFTYCPHRHESMAL